MSTMPNATVPVPNADPENNPRYLPVYQAVFRGIGGINALLNGTRLVPLAAAIRQQLELAAVLQL